MKVDHGFDCLWLTIKAEINPLIIQIGLMSYEHLYKCLNIPASYWCHNPPHCRRNLVEVKKMVAQHNQISLGKENCISLQGVWDASRFKLLPGLFKIVAKSADGSAILFLRMYVDVVRKWVLWDFLHFGVLSHIEKVPNKLISPNWLCWGWVPL